MSGLDKVTGARRDLLRIGTVAAIAGLILVVGIMSPPPVDAAGTVVSIDTDSTGNAATTVGTIQSCRSLNAGASANVDIVIQDVPSLSGFEADVLYNGALVHVTGESSAFILMQPLFPPPILFDLSDPVPDSDGTYNVLVSSTGNGTGSGVVVRLTLQGMSAGESTLDLANVKMKDFNNLPVQPANAGGFFTGTVNDGRIAVGGPCDPDTDGDGVIDSTDNCPHWPNPAQNLPPWSVPAGDTDCDGFPSTTTALPRGRENFIGTQTDDRCPDSTADDAWPPDVNNNGATNLSDVVAFGPTFNKMDPDPAYNQRFDLNASGGVNLSDIVAIGPFFNKSCTV